MKKISKLLMLAVVALGVSFTACNNEDLPGGPDNKKEANTHATITLKMPIKGTRALPNDYNDVGEWAGQDKIEDLAVYLDDGTDVVVTEYSLGDFSIHTDASDNLVFTPLKAIKVPADTYDVYVLINKKGIVLPVGASATFLDAYHNVAQAQANSGTDATVSTSADNLASVDDGDDVITMTNVEIETVVVEPNVTEAVALSGAKNRASVTVERAVARVMVTIADNSSFEVKNAGGDLVGIITNVTWALAQGENSLYLQRKDTWETPEYAWKPSLANDFESEAGGKYDYSGLFFKHTTVTAGYNGTPVPTVEAYGKGAEVIGAASILNGQFVLPTTHEYGAPGTETTPYAGGYEKGNTVYAIVRATYVPQVLADGGTLATDGTFYYGGMNGKYYTTAANALDPATNGIPGQTVAKYEGGKVIYYAWANPDNVATPFNSPVIRNNIYHIHITGFKTIGTNWNPLFPEDPTRELEDPTKPYDPVENPYKDKENPDPKPTPEMVPDPDNPGEEIPTEEPENPIDPEDPLTTPETWMSVDVKVLPWIVHSYQIDLGI